LPKRWWSVEMFLELFLASRLRYKRHVKVLGVHG